MGDRPPIIVGAGPAGIRAAATLAAAGLAPIVIDEAPASGGQIYRRAPAGFTRPYRAIYGFEAAKARRVHDAFDGLGGSIDYRPGTLVWDLRQGALHCLVRRAQRAGSVSRHHPRARCARPDHPLSGLDPARRLHAGRRADRLEVPGLRHRRARRLHGHRTAALSRRLPVREGGRRGRRRARHRALRREAPRAARPAARRSDVRQGPVVRRGIARPRHRHGKRHQAGRRRGKGRRGLGLRLSRRGGRGTAAGLRRDRLRLRSELRDAARRSGGDSLRVGPRAAAIPAGARHRRPHAASRASIWPATGAALPAPTPPSSAASARRSRCSRIAAMPSTRRVWRRSSARCGRSPRCESALETAFPFPVDIAAAMSDETILCRCEGVTAGEFRQAARALDADEINRAKAFSRCGMGRCQGRVCGPAAAVVLAAALDASPEQHRQAARPAAGQAHSDGRGFMSAPVRPRRGSQRVGSRAGLG